METNKEKIVRIFQDYLKAFQSMDPKNVVPFYHVPFMSVAARRVRVLTTEVDIEENYGNHMEILKQYDYAETKMKDINIKELSDGLMLIGVSLERYAKNGDKIGEQDVDNNYTFTFRKVDDKWKIVVTLVHDSLLKLD